MKGRTSSFGDWSKVLNAMACLRQPRRLTGLEFKCACASLLLWCFPIGASLLAQESSTERHKVGVVEYVSPYGFCFSLPENWKGFSILQKEWEGYTSCSKGDCTVTHGPQVVIRNPKWTSTQPHEDIPVMVFTVRQWESLQQGKFFVSAAPFGPGELGRNSKYVFALPARYNYDFSEGWEQVGTIIQSHPLHAPCPAQ